MKPWIPISGVLVSESAVHLGQVGQPSPEPVTRTTPPETISTPWPSSEATVKRRMAGVTAVGSLSAMVRAALLSFPRVLLVVLVVLL